MDDPIASVATQSPQATSPRGGVRPISNARHARARTIATVVAVAVCMLILPTLAHASHVGTVSITPAIGTLVADVCGPFLVQAQGGSDPFGAVVDVEVVGTTPVQFCLPASGVNPVLIDPTTGDRGGGSDGAIGGEATADAGTLPGEGDFLRHRLAGFGVVRHHGLRGGAGRPERQRRPRRGRAPGHRLVDRRVRWRRRRWGTQCQVDHHDLGQLRGTGPIVGCRLRARSQGRGEAGQEGARSSGWSRHHRRVGPLSRLRPEPERSFLCHRDEEGRRRERRRRCLKARSTKVRR